jgi:spore coat protein U-like protein
VNKAIACLSLCIAAQAAGAATLCRFVSSGMAAFGPYDTLSAAPRDTVVTFQVRCDRNGGPANVQVDIGLGVGVGGTSPSSRRMRQVGGSGDYLSYGLYRDIGRSSVWGFSPGVDTVQQTLSVPNRGSALATFTIYGRLPPLQNVSAGSYTDSVQVTLTP